MQTFWNTTTEVMLLCNRIEETLVPLESLRRAVNSLLIASRVHCLPNYPLTPLRSLPLRLFFSSVSKKSSVVDLDPELFGWFGSGIIVPDLDLTFLAREFVKFLKIFLYNGPIRL
jgi:hypothetical protein